MRSRQRVHAESDSERFYISSQCRHEAEKSTAGCSKYLFFFSRHPYVDAIYQREFRDSVLSRISLALRELIKQAWLLKSHFSATISYGRVNRVGQCKQVCVHSTYRPRNRVITLDVNILQKPLVVASLYTNSNYRDYPPKVIFLPNYPHIRFYYSRALSTYKKLLPCLSMHQISRTTTSY